MPRDLPDRLTVNSTLLAVVLSFLHKELGKHLLQAHGILSASLDGNSAFVVRNNLKVFLGNLKRHEGGIIAVSHALLTVKRTDLATAYIPAQCHQSCLES